MSLVLPFATIVLAAAPLLLGLDIFVRIAREH